MDTRASAPDEGVIIDYPMPLCAVCARYQRNQSAGHECAAYQDGIPEAILTSQADHRQAYAGDHDLRFEPRDTAARRYARELFGG